MEEKVRNPKKENCLKTHPLLLTLELMVLLRMRVGSLIGRGIIRSIVLLPLVSLQRWTFTLSLTIEVRVLPKKKNFWREIGVIRLTKTSILSGIGCSKCWVGVVSITKS